MPRASRWWRVQAARPEAGRHQLAAHRFGSIHAPRRGPASDPKSQNSVKGIDICIYIYIYIYYIYIYTYMESQLPYSWNRNYLIAEYLDL